MKFTEKQQEAIDIRGCNVLVSAAAGSGKTGVLTERILSRLRDGESIDELLMLTFTRAAAGEMKNRIREKIRGEADGAGEESRSFWQQQLTFLSDAPVTTIHSFCLRLLRRHYHLIPGLDPKFRIGDDRRMAILREDLLSAYLEECYTEADEEKRRRFFDLLSLYGSRLSDEGLKKEILHLMDFSCAQGDPEAWLDEKYRRFCDIDGWYREVMDVARQDIALLKAETLHDIETMNDLAGPLSAIETLKGDLLALSDLETAEWDALSGAKPFGKKKPKRKEEDPGQNEYIKLRRDIRKKYFEDRVAVYFRRPFSDYAREISAVAEAIDTLTAMVKTFFQRYSEEKLKRATLDFSDLELLTLRLLKENPGLVREYQSFFKEVLVDEYQDINPLQEQILSLLAGEGRLFAVGDIKQSIYGFRLADHRLFQNRMVSYGLEKANENGRLIYLNRNFRSRWEVLDLTNHVFSALMNPGVSGLSYGTEEALYCGADYREQPGAEAELVVLDIPREDPKGEYENLACHGRFIAKKIEEMMTEGFLVQERDGTQRPLAYGDIAVLMRSANQQGEGIGTELAARGIPVQTPSTTGFLSGRETRLLRSFLAVLDNPLQDIPLAAVMRSPLFGFDEDALLLLSLDRKGKKLWEQILTVEEADTEGLDKEKVIAFREVIGVWRQRAKIYPVGELVDMILKEFDYAAFWGGLPNGRRRIKYLNHFVEEAFGFQQEEVGGLFDFLRYLDHLAAGGGDAVGEGEGSDDCVQVMNIHRSKGLEFPVVFLVRTEKRFNRSDLTATLVVDDLYGFGPQWKDRKRRIVTDTLPRMLIRSRKLKDDTAEEMRVLYVALTRAKEKLIITAANSATTKLSVAERLGQYGDAVYYDDCPQLPVTLLMADSSYEGWILHGLSPRRCPVPFQGSVLTEPKVVDAPAPLPPFRQEKVVRKLSPADLERLKDTLHRKEAPPLLSKVSVTSLLPPAEEEDAAVTLPRPRFLQDSDTLTAAEKGTAFHLFMEKLPLDREWQDHELEAFAAELVTRGVLSPAGCRSLDLVTVQAFLQSRYGRELQTAGELRRELSFVGGFPASSLFPDAAGDDRTVILQGAVDLIYRRDDGTWVLVDYKTNDIRHRGKEAFLAKYGRQMELYREAMKRIYDIDVAESVFFMTKTREFISYEREDRSI